MGGQQAGLDGQASGAATGDGPARARRAARIASATAAVLAAAAFAWWAAGVWTGRRSLSPVAFSVGGLSVRWYGLVLALSFVPAWLVARPERERLGLSADDLLDGLLLGIPLGLMGARLGFVVQNLDYFAAHPLDVFRTRAGGLSMHGVLAGVAVAVLVFARRRRVPPAAVADLAAPSVLAAQAVGRWGNFFNFEVLGYPTGLPWALYVPPPLRPTGFEQAAWFHPAFLYESVLDAAGAAALIGYRRRQDRRPGEVAALYLVLYGVIRFGVEWVRIGRAVALGLTLAQWVSLAMVAAGAAWWLAARWQGRQAMVQ